MRRREFIAVLGGAATWPPAASAQQRTRIARIGFLGGGSPHAPLWRRNFNTFRQTLQNLGHVEGQNIAIEYRLAEGNVDRLADLANELVSLKVDLIVAAPTPAAVAARNATDTIPIVMFNVGDPVGLGIVASLARPGGNVTGLAFTVGTETFGKGLELLKEAVPDLRRVAVLSNSANPGHALVIRNLESAARRLDLETRGFETRGPEDFARAFAGVVKERAGAFYTIADVQYVAHAAHLADLALEHRLPSMHQFREQVEAGGLMSYGPDFSSPWRGAATFVDKLLKGARPADLPVEQPTKFDLVLNLKTARALGLTVLPTLLARADEVIE